MINLKKVLEQNEAIKTNIVQLQLVNEQITKKLETFEERQKASDIKLHIMKSFLQGNNLEIHGIPACENEEVR